MDWFSARQSDVVTDYIVINDVVIVPIRVIPLAWLRPAGELYDAAHMMLFSMIAHSH
jgi:hypothetical protein